MANSFRLCILNRKNFIARFDWHGFSLNVNERWLAIIMYEPCGLGISLPVSRSPKASSSPSFSAVKGFLVWRADFTVADWFQISFVELQLLSKAELTDYFERDFGWCDRVNFSWEIAFANLQKKYVIRHTLVWAEKTEFICFVSIFDKYANIVNFWLFFIWTIVSQQQKCEPAQHMVHTNWKLCYDKNEGRMMQSLSYTHTSCNPTRITPI